jgi:hypothetical protein
MESLERPLFRDAMPPAKQISLEEYRKLKAEYIRKSERWRPGGSLRYHIREADDWRTYSLRLESFDDDNVWVAELTQYKSKGWDWVARYQLDRSPHVDEEFAIPQILQGRSRVIGGVKYGMTVDEVIAKKGGHYKINWHAEAGSAHLVYDDVKVSVRQWSPPRGGGRVVDVEPTTNRTMEFLKDVPYEDEK